MSPSTTENLDESLIIPLDDEINMEFRLIPAGSFRMGSRGYDRSEEPIHHVQISRPFYLGIIPVTQSQFGVWIKSLNFEQQYAFPENPQHPVENIDWYQSMSYCNWITLNYKEYLPRGFIAGLPTEAEWEYACRAGTKTEYHTGDGESALKLAGWYRSSSTHKVGELEKNEWGLYDMHGNVFEWCQDAYDANVYKTRPDGVLDPVYSNDDKKHVIRGGGWYFSPKNCRSAVRKNRPAYDRVGGLGFRVCLSPDPSAHEKTSAADPEPLPGDE